MFTPTLSVLILLAGVVVGAEGKGPDQADATDDLDRVELETATFSMYCYWTGEATVGRVDGVAASRIGHWDGREIVQVDFDPQQTSVDELALALSANRSLYAVHPGVGEPAPQTRAEVKVLRGQPRFIEPKHSLRTVQPAMAALDLTEEQAIVLNSWAYFGGPMPDVLTDEQREELARRSLP